ncbi:dihydropteroate synthase [Planctomycetaceae bacterium]|jgi:dihydropteroate synthase|nr:dihydropteroate synthase [Planctomycetaceae bacterium]
MNGEARLMGIVNVTPDSFSDGGHFLESQLAIDHALGLEADGAQFLDIGGESTRPGADPVSVNDELKRVIPVIEGLREQTSCLISIDTTKSEVAREALSAGADIVNDISGLTFDPKMLDVCAESDCGVIAMHIKGTPQTMQDDPSYENVVEEVTNFLAERLSVLTSAGIAEERIMLDPGIGFGKTAAHNLELMQDLAVIRALGRPLLIGHSRKRFLQQILGREVEERVAGTVGVSIALRMLGADLLRVHDVRSVKDAITACGTLLGWDVNREQAVE